MALPANCSVNAVALVLVSTAVRPVGTFVAVALPVARKSSPFAPVQVSLDRVSVLVSVIAPILVIASLNIVLL